MRPQRPLLCTYYPGYHPVAGLDWQEWALVRQAVPHFPGHAKPDQPAWGFLPDDAPETLQRQIRTAADHGIDGFLICWWWRPGGPTGEGEQIREATLTRALLPALTRVRAPFRFALLWVPCWPRHRLPVRPTDPEQGDLERFFPFGTADLATLLRQAAPWFREPAYFTVNSRPCFVFFHAWRLVQQLGVEAARTALALLREQACQELALPGLFLVASVNALGEEQLLTTLGFDAFTSYVWWPDWKGERFQDYAALTAARARDWRVLAQRLPVPYLPSICVGWDATPRGAPGWDPTSGPRFPWSPIVTGRSPAAFGAALRAGLDFLDEQGTPPEYPLLVASWNEWSEGHYLEPDVREGYAYLDVLRRIRG